MLRGSPTHLFWKLAGYSIAMTLGVVAFALFVGGR